jgi:FAD/FMN-containing dehydrogenase
MAATDTIHSELRTLRALSTGSVVAAGDADYDEARLAWNLAADQRPAAVVFPETDSDVSFAVAFAREAGLRVNVQGTGHNATPLGDMSDTLLIRTNRMKGVEIDAAGRRARVQAGAEWADVTGPASEHGLAALAGSSPNVGVVGYSLGGGIGYLGRKHGIQANSVTAIELVTADGEHRRVTAERDPELFWAMRGGGGNFGVVTALEFRLYPLPELFGGALMWPWEHAESVFKRWRDWTSNVPDDVTSMARIIQFPPIDDVPEFLRGRQMVVITAAYAGDAQTGALLMEPLTELGPEINTFGPMPPSALSYLHMDPEGPVPGLSDTAMLDSLPDEAIETIIEKAGPGSDSVMLITELRHMGGAFARAEDGHGALAKIDGEYIAFAVGMVMSPEMGEALARQTGALMEALAPHGRGRKYLNFVEHRTDTRSGYADDAYARLQAVREKVDPDYLFRANHEIA